MMLYEGVEEMTLEECYNKIGANYNDLVKRLGSKDFAELFAKKFLDDDSFANLEKALAEQNAEDAFRAVHTLKGVAQNLSLDNLYRVSFTLTENLRGLEITAESQPLFEAVKTEYERTVAALKELA